MARSKLFNLYILTTITVISVLLLLEIATRYYNAQPEESDRSVTALMADMPKSHISGRELDNQMIVHNIALFNQYPNPESVKIGYVGTSRSKVLSPNHFGIPAAVVGAGNSYNEMTYGLLSQAEILRLRFPNIKYVYVETSMLLRRPGRLIVEDDHQKYLPLLQSFRPLCMQLPVLANCREIFKSLDTNSKPLQKIHSELLKRRSEFKLSSLLTSQQKNQETPVMSAHLLAGLSTNGERETLPQATIPKSNQVATITKDNIKVQRLRDVLSYQEGDGLFNLIALWGIQHHIQVIFFQPPVRSDLYHYKLEYGIEQHVADIQRISRQYNIPFIDLNKPNLGYMDDWSLFNNEDHLETCLGSGLLTLALKEGYERFESNHELFPTIERHALELSKIKELAICR